MASVAMLPSGMAICCSLPDILFLPELVFGGLVWILVACTYIFPANPQAYVMAVSLFCFCMSFIWMMVFLCGSHHNRSSWATADVLYHGLAAMLYLSASVFLALVTIGFGTSLSVPGMSGTNQDEIDAILKFYRLDISAVVFSFITTLLYTIHTIFSGIRWKIF
ncbi:myelin and lymphocyte protein-like [Ictalurus furcatus]|uniref:myelin and lymphocyte protein-like n=1 Tax=Ictalurus furcatus TaxID=66913 RepID=UPI002350DD96|nr:myelin and lymphocyte protein-like [Ictalurus furcatus]